MLISLIAIITIVSVLGTGMLYLTTTSTYTSLYAGPSSNSQARAYHLAEAGIAHARWLLDQHRDDDDPEYYPEGTYTLANGDRFILTSYDYNDKGTIDKKRVTIEAVSVVHAGTLKVIKYGIYREDPNKDLPKSNGNNENSNEGEGEGETQEFIDFMHEEQGSIYVGPMNISGGGSGLSGEGATVVIREPLTNPSGGGGSSIAVTTIYIDGPVILDKGSTGLGSCSVPGNIYINGNLDLWGGSHTICGDVYVNGNLRLMNSKIYGNIYVNGTVELGWGAPDLSSNTHIYYVGDGNPSTPDIIHPQYYNQAVLDKCHKIPYGDVQAFPSFSMPDVSIPDPRSSDWFPPKGYVSSGTLVSGLKIYTEGNYNSSAWRPTAENVIIVSKGNISITGMGGSDLSGVLYAPYGKVTFNGRSFTGTVIARDGFDVTSGGTTVTSRGIENYIANPDDYPFKLDEQIKIIQY